MRQWIACVLSITFLAACQQEEIRSPARPYPTGPALATAVPVEPAETAVWAQPGGLLAELVNPGETPMMWPPPVPTLPPMAQPVITDDQRATWQALAHTALPDRDEVRLAMAYRGLAAPPPPIAEGDPLRVGDRHTFNITQNNTNRLMVMEAVLASISEHAYFWFDTGPDSLEPDPQMLPTVGAAFDTMYETAVAIFGPEATPGVDGDPRIHIVTVSPWVLCDVTPATANACGLAGYFNDADARPPAVYPNGNGREMFVMNSSWFGEDFFLNVLGHEFRHMIENNYDVSDVGWEIEGSATLAEELLGFPANAQLRGNAFLEAPDLPLNEWSAADKTPLYGQGYLFNRYLYDQLGPDLYRQFSQHPADGLAAIDAVATANGLPVDGETMWLDWLVALAIHNHPHAPDFYRFGQAGLNTVTAVRLNKLPHEIETTVHQYAADYYELPAGERLRLTFTGSTAVSLLPVSPVSGERMWLAQRGNYSNPRLTRTVDLTGVKSATLAYTAYVDLEHGFDFAYVAASTDDGRTWQPLTALHMQGLSATDDPAGAALAGRFYTGRAQHWVQETVDLTPYAGQRIQLRFEVVTDPAVNHSGFALDNIAIPDIGFYDDVEVETDGWAAEGFVRATAVIPQNWHLQLITFPDGIPHVVTIPLPKGQSTAVSMETNPGEKPPILIVAATAPHTSLPACYQLSVMGDP